MVVRMGARGGIEPVTTSTSALNPQRAYRRLTHEDRVFIEMASNSTPAWSMRAIGRHLGVAASTILRELGRHRVETGRGRGGSRETRYHAGVAHHHTMRSRVRTRARKLDCHELRSLVVTGLNEKHSPQQIAGRRRMMFPNQPQLWVSHETIYQALYVQGRGSLWWEGDLIVGKDAGSAIGTLVERKTRMIRLLHLTRRDGQTLRQTLIERMGDLPPDLLRSITWDQGTEMAQHRAITAALGVPVYFCDSRSPWQRGSNENSNGLLRDYFPKGTDLSVHSPQHLLAVENELNRRPRQVIQDCTPTELFESLLTSSHVTCCNDD